MGGRCPQKRGRLNSEDAPVLFFVGGRCPQKRKTNEMKE
jgi:hypothetical protein